MATTDTWLTPAEVAALTDYKTERRQCVALADMGIPFRTSRTGRPLVERSAVLRNDGVTGKKKRPEPDWGAMQEKAA